MNSLSVSCRSPCLTYLNFRPYRLQPPHSLQPPLLHVTPQLVWSPLFSGFFPSFSGSRFCLSLAGSPVLFGRIEFVILRLSLSPPAAPHRVSHRRSCSRLQAGERMPEGDFHPSVQFYFLRTLTGARAQASPPACEWKMRAKPASFPNKSGRDGTCKRSACKKFIHTQASHLTPGA
jgi:hypothetical protein